MPSYSTIFGVVFVCWLLFIGGAFMLKAQRNSQKQAKRAAKAAKKAQDGGELQQQPGASKVEPGLLTKTLVQSTAATNFAAMKISEKLM